MKNLSVKKLALAGMFCALAVVGSVFSFPIFGSKCAPVQHMVNILCAVLLGPYYGVGVAFVASLLRNLLGLGSLMAFPGSMFGALLCGLTYHKAKQLLPTLVAPPSWAGCAPTRWPSCSWARAPVTSHSTPTSSRSWSPRPAVPSLRACCCSACSVRARCAPCRPA